jgi:ribosome-associated heat shock protein Hsp15
LPEPSALRIDKWLWYARLFKARERAAAFVETGHLRLAHPGGDPQRVLKASQIVKPGDVLTLALPGAVRVLRVEALGHRRGPPAEACALYVELSS